MLLNYLKLAIRLLVRNPFFTAINVIGIAIGFASFFALWSYSNSELKSNQYHKDSDRIARIGGYWRWTDDGKNWDYITFGFTKADLPIRIKEDFPEVEDYTRILTQQFFTKNIFPHDNSISLSTVGGSSEERVFKEDKVIYADQNLFEMFTIPLIHGEATNVLREAGSVVLSETMAKKYFDDINPTGELLKLNDTLTLNVTGVFQNLPHYTHFDFDMVMSNKAYLAKLQAQSFTAAQNFIKLRPGASLPDLERKINQKKKEYWAAVLSTKPNVDIDMFLQELHDIVFSKSFEGDEFTSRSKPVLLTFSIISFVILGMVWCNYLNLWLARNASREKEMATRKVNGASAKDFIFQFITESFIVNSIALLLALTLLQLMKTPLKTFFNIHISELSDIKPDTALIFLLSIFLSVGLTGIYPAMVALTRHPGALLRRSKVPETKRTLASVLAIIQYTSAVVVILWAFLIYLELNHILNGNLGLDRENVVVIEAPVKKGRAFAKQFDVYSNQLSSHQQVTHLSYGKFMPGDYIGAAKLMHRRGNTLDVGFDYNGVDERFIPFFGLKLVAGRNFIKDDRSDAVIISRSATQRLGFENPELAIGAILEVDKGFVQAEWLTVEIVGVFEDFRIQPFFETRESRTKFGNQQQSRGIFLTYKNQTFADFLPERIALKVLPQNFDKVLSIAEREFKSMFPGQVFSWYLLDDSINHVYQNEKVLRNQILLFVVLAVSIACIGFLGVIMHRATAKTKEIGIRKILGADLSHIGKLILRSSAMQFFIAFSIGVPIAWYLGEIYMQKFSERVVLHWWHYTIPVVAFLSIMLCSVVTIIWKSARRNPVEALKYE